MTFKFKRLSIPDLILVEPKMHRDGRGYFMETYKLSEFSLSGIPAAFVQDNHSQSLRAVLRGLHFQKSPKAQGKLVRVLSGEIFDVAIDLRKGSPTYGRWSGETLSAENNRMLYIPQGFAHGFCVLGDSADVHYKVTEEYSAEHEFGIIWNDPDISIDWPIRNPTVSEKDAAYSRLKDTDTGFVYRGRL